MVNSDKVKKKLAGLLLDEPVSRPDSNYQRKMRRVRNLERKKPSVFDSLFQNLLSTLDALDREAEKSGSMHVYFDENQNLRKRWKKR